MTHTDGLKNVETLINRFGGMRPMARKIDVPVSTIQGWKKRDFIPADRVGEVLKAARTNHVSLEGFDISSTSNDTAKINHNEKPTDNTTSSRASTDDPVVTSPLRPREDHKNSKFKNYEQPNYLNAKQIRSDAVKRSVITTLVIFLVLGGIAYMLFGQDAKNLTNISQDQQEIDRRLSKFRDDYNSFENTVTDGMNSLNNRVTDVAAAVGVERNAQGKVVFNNNMSMSERVTALESRLRASGEEIDLGQMVSRFENIAKSVQGQGNTDAAMTDLKSIIDNIQGRMGDLDAALEQAKKDNDELAESLQNVTGRDLSAAAMLLAMTQMRESLNRAQPFSDDLEVLQSLVGTEDPELTAAINRLAPYAEGGVLTPEGLSEELRGLTGEIISAALRGEDVSVKEKMAARLGQILSIEKNGKPIMGIKEQTIIANAQNALDRGDVSTAVAELNKLEGPAAEAAAPVKSQAQGTLNAEKTIGMLMQNMLQKMQNPNQVRGLIQSVPQEIKKQMQGTVHGSQESGLIILE